MSTYFIIKAASGLAFIVKEITETKADGLTARGDHLAQRPERETVLPNALRHF